MIVLNKGPGVQAQAQARELAEAAARSQVAARETRAHARRQASAFETHRAHMAQELAALAQRCSPAAPALHKMPDV